MEKLQKTLKLLSLTSFGSRSCKFPTNNTLGRCSSHVADKKEPKKEDEASEMLKKLLNDPPTTCCMSGCSNCVWIAYAEELAKVSKDAGEIAKSMIEKNVTDPSLKAFLLTELKFRL